MKRPKLSVIITTKNEEKYIENCLKSLATQSFRDFEVVVSDAESRDGTVKIAERYACKVIVKKTNIAEGRNLGAMMANGEVFVFVDADTMLMPDTLRDIWSAFKDGKVVGATCPALPTSTESKYVGTYIVYNTFCKNSIKVRRPHVAGFFCAYRRSAFERVGGFDGGVGILEDFHLSLRMGKLGKIKFVDSTMVITSHRRIKEWGIKTPHRYMQAWLKLIATGKSFSGDWYKPVR